MLNSNTNMDKPKVTHWTSSAWPRPSLEHKTSLTPKWFCSFLYDRRFLAQRNDESDASLRVTCTNWVAANKHINQWTKTHTLAQKHLCEFLLWNASRVQKHSSKTKQEKLVDPTWNSVWRMLSTSLLEGSEGSDAALSDCENRTGTENWKHGIWQLVQQFKLSSAGTSGWSDHSSTEMP